MPQAAPWVETPWESALETFRRASIAPAVASSWRELFGRLKPRSPFLAHWEETWRRIRDAADPELALGRWLRWVEDDLEEPEAGRAGRWAASPDLRRGWITLAGVSPALGDCLLQNWRRYDPQAWSARWATREALESRLRAEVDDLGEAEFAERVRGFRFAEVLRIAHLDCVELLPVDRVTEQISVLADVVVEVCLDRALKETARRRGLVPPEGGIAVLALGKLGGRELNYSSDIDLNFIYDEGLGRLQKKDGTGVEGGWEVEHYFTRSCERLVDLLTRLTPSGALYRLDTRLRPDAGTARLVWSVRASVDYYWSAGRNWERQALLRARHCAGDEAVSRRFLGEVQDFVYPASLTRESLEEMRGLKLQAERIAVDRGEDGEEVKIGQGGIRDVEYIVQYFQLLHGARRPAVRVANIFDALEALEREQLLNTEETDVLRRGYRWLRRVEHRLQLDQMLQTHRLPSDPRARWRLARGLGFPSFEAFSEKLARQTASIRRVYALLFESGTRERTEDELLADLLDLPFASVEETEVARLAPYGFEDPREAFRRLQALAGHGAGLVDAAHAKEVFRGLLPGFLRELSRHPEPDRTLSNFEDCVSSLGARSVFYQLLDESPRFLELFVDVCSRSNLVVELMRGHPDLFDEVVDCLLTGYRFDRELLVRRAEELVARDGELLAQLFDFKYVHLLLTAIRDLAGDARLRETLQNIAAIAEGLLRGALALTREEAERRLGTWQEDAPRWCVLALGKFGGEEMTYRSDLDLVLLYEGRGKTTRGIGAREYFERFSQKLLATCKRADAVGPLLEIDLRLRPMGSHNSLVTSFDAWRTYFTKGAAETWERQAFLRARPVAGDEELGRRALAFIREELVLGGAAGPGDADTVRQDVRHMRRRLEEHAGRGDLKRGVGGIVDVEFLVQALQLLHGGEHPEVVVPNTAQAIERLAAAGLLGSNEAAELFSSYRFLRWLECRLSLVGDRGVSLDSTDDATLDLLVHKIGYRSTGEERAEEIFRSELAYHRRKNRESLERVLGTDEPASGR